MRPVRSSVQLREVRLVEDEMFFFFEDVCGLGEELPFSTNRGIARQIVFLPFFSCLFFFFSFSSCIYFQHLENHRPQLPWHMRSGRSRALWLEGHLVHYLLRWVQ